MINKSNMLHLTKNLEFCEYIISSIATRGQHTPTNTMNSVGVTIALVYTMLFSIDSTLHCRIEAKTSNPYSDT